MAITIASILTNVKTRAGRAARRLNDDNLPPTDANDADLTIHLNHAAREIAQMTGRVAARATITLVDDQAAYDLDGTSIHELTAFQVDIDGAVTAVSIASGEAVRRKTEDDDAESGVPTEAGLFGQKVYLHPIPTFTTSGSLYVFYVPASLVGESDTLTTDELPAGDLVNYLPPEFERMLENYVLAWWYLDQGDVYGLAPPLLAQYQRDLHEGRSKRPLSPRRIRQSYKPLC